MQALLKRYAGSDAVRGPFPSVRVGCAISYDVDFSRYRSGLMPMDMPASQNGMSTMFGGNDMPYDTRSGVVVAHRGRYEPPANSSNGSYQLDSMFNNIHRIADANATSYGMLRTVSVPRDS